MSVVNNNLLLAAEDADLGYVIDRSLRFRSSASAYLNRTPASASNRKTWTWSGWVKRGELNLDTLISCHSAQNDNANIDVNFESDNTFYIIGWNTTFLKTTQVFRDPSAWYHIVVAVDTTNATANNRIRVYVNGSEVTSFSTRNNPSLNADLGLNQAATTRIGSASNAVGNLFDGYLTEINFVDGQALTPTSFGEYNEDTGVWQPKAYEGTYGTNGFYLNFGDPTTLTTLTADQSGNGNNWTANNISLTSGATFDSMIDTPTPVTDVRGNFAVLNPLDNTNSLSAGNLQITNIPDTSTRGSFGLISGKWYWEYTVGSMVGSLPHHIGIHAGSLNSDNARIIWRSDGNIFKDASLVTTVASYTTNDVLAVSFDGDSRELKFYKNNALQTTQTATATSFTYLPYHLAGGLSTGAVMHVNFGQRPFEYTPPSGFKALHTGNLPEPAIVDGGEYFNTVLYTGNFPTGQSITGVGFAPDLTWFKSRSVVSSHNLVDKVRGAFRLRSNTTDAESSATVTLDSDGFTVGSQSESNDGSMVAWNWKANGAGVTNTAGSITSTVSANTTSGFSIVSSVGTGAAGTTGHGLGVKPAFIIRKSRTSAFGHWYVYHHSVGASSAGILQLTNAFAGATAWNSTEPTSTVFSVGSAVDENKLNDNYITYCFAEVPGYSRFGSYTGNGSADGPFIFTGFRPAWVMVKRTNSTGDWNMFDSSRNSFNTNGARLFANLANAEGSGDSAYSLFSNGFKLGDADGSRNASGSTYIFMAFAETDFANALAR